MSDPEIPSRFSISVAPPDALLSTIRSAVKKEPASTLGVRTRVILAGAMSPLVIVGVLVGGSRLFDRSALRFDIGTVSPIHLVAVLASLVVLAVVTTIVALRP